MRHLRILHNGDLREGTIHPSAHWMVHVREDGAIWGEVLTEKWARLLPEGFSVPDAGRFFDIPPSFRDHQLEKQPHHEEIIVSLVEPSGRHLCSFLKSQLGEDSQLRAALDELVRKIEDITEQIAPGNAGWRWS